MNIKEKKRTGWEGGSLPGWKGKCEQHEADLDGENCRARKKEANLTSHFILS